MLNRRAPHSTEVALTSAFSLTTQAASVERRMRVLSEIRTASGFIDRETIVGKKLPQHAKFVRRLIPAVPASRSHRPIEYRIRRSANLLLFHRPRRLRFVALQQIRIAQNAKPRKPHRCCRPKRVRGLTSPLRFVQPRARMRNSNCVRCSMECGFATSTPWPAYFKLAPFSPFNESEQHSLSLTGEKGWG